jgi:hypothetical protein
MVVGVGVVTVEAGAAVFVAGKEEWAEANWLRMDLDFFSGDTFGEGHAAMEMLLLSLDLLC